MNQQRKFRPAAGLALAALLATTLTACGIAQTRDPVSDTTAQTGAVSEGHVVSHQGVHEYRLANGLKLLIKEDHRAPVVVSQVWYKVGSSYEHNGITGASHVLEHMMFKGTHKLGPNEFSRIIAANGGRENAFTSQDYTAYYQQLEKSRLPISFELEAERMANLNMAEEEFAKEIQVVMEERRMRTEDDPRALTYEQFSAAAFVNSPYHHPVIGWMSDLQDMKVDDLRRWYQSWYAPNNATLVVVGDVQPEQVFQLAKQHFGPLKPRPLPPIKPQRELAQKGARRITVRAPAELPYLIMGYKVPVIATAQEAWEPYALDMLTSILDGGASARFARELVRGQEIAVGAGAGYDITSRLDDLLIFSGTPSNGHSVAELEQAFRAQIDNLQNTPVDPAELDRIKAQVVASKIYEQDSIYYQAMQLGMLETVGLDWRMLDDYVDKLRAVTAEQVQAVARKYLIDDRLTVAVLEPLPLNGALSRSGGAPRMLH
jgi:zinc protease